MKCIKCSGELVEGANFCKFCGQNQSEKVESVENEKTEEITETTDKIEETTKETEKKAEEPAKIINTDAIKQQASEVAEKIKSVDLSEIKKNADELVGNAKEFTEKNKDNKNFLIGAGVAGVALVLIFSMMISSLFSGSSNSSILYLTDDYEFYYKANYKESTKATELFDHSINDRRTELLTDDNILYVFISEENSSQYKTTLYYYDLNAKDIKEVEVDDFKSDWAYVNAYKESGDNIYFKISNILYYFNKKDGKVVEVIEDVSTVLLDSNDKPAFVTTEEKDNLYALHKIVSTSKTEEIDDEFVTIYAGEYNEDVGNVSDLKIYARKYGEMYSYNVKSGKLELEYEIVADKEKYDDDYTTEAGQNYNERAIILSSKYYYVSYKTNLPLSTFINVDVEFELEKVVDPGTEPQPPIGEPVRANYDSYLQYLDDYNIYTNSATYQSYLTEKADYNAIVSQNSSIDRVNASIQTYIDAVKNLNSDNYTQPVTYYDIYEDGVLIHEKMSTISRFADPIGRTISFEPVSDTSKYKFTDIIDTTRTYSNYENILSALNNYVYNYGGVSSQKEEIFVRGENINETSLKDLYSEVGVKLNDSDKFIDNMAFAQDGNLYISVKDYTRDEFEMFQVVLKNGELSAAVSIYEVESTFSGSDYVYINQSFYNPYTKTQYFEIRENGEDMLYVLKGQQLVEICDDFYNIRFYKNGTTYIGTDYDSAGSTGAYRLNKLVNDSCESVIRTVSNYSVLQDGSILYLKELTYSSSNNLRGSDLYKITKNDETVVAEDVIYYRPLDLDTDYE